MQLDKQLGWRRTAAVHAFCNVVNLDGNCLGRSTLTEQCLLPRFERTIPGVLIPSVPEASRSIEDPHAVPRASHACFSFSLSLLVLLKAVACDGLQSVAVRDLERSTPHTRLRRPSSSPSSGCSWWG